MPERFHVDNEIASQPDCWREAISRAAQAAPALQAPGERVAFVGCGTSWFVAQILAALRERAGFGESDAYTASELLDRPYDRVIAVTRSGTSSEVVELLERATTPTVAILGNLDTPAGAAASESIDLSFANEQSVVQTRFATSTLALARTAYGEDLSQLISGAEAVLALPLPSDLVGAQQITFLGQGWTIGFAHEAALKVRETSSGWAESYPAMDYRHGPISVAEPGRAVWAFGQVPMGLAEEIQATGALFVDHQRDPMVELILAQRVAVARAVAAGRNPDQPRSLGRSVILSDV